jgi:hypothetical protein
MRSLIVGNALAAVHAVLSLPCGFDGIRPCAESPRLFARAALAGVLGPIAPCCTSPSGDCAVDLDCPGPASETLTQRALRRAP